ncbi:Hint domain-containing protein [Vannielia sp. SX4]|uniref:Hint domain-containing protein n=1 Tax=Vannielia sp. SX4 TaxID=3463852 RepID=UPI004058DC7F
MTKVTLDFNGESAGTVIDDEYASKGVTISSIVDGKVNYYKSPAMIFDTSNPTGGDHDLATSNLGNVLIISEDGDSNDPDDEACGGTLVFDFTEEVTFHSLTLLDVEEGAKIKFYDDNGHYMGYHYVTTANNGQCNVDFGNIEGVGKVEVVFNGSGAVDNVSYTTPAPEGDGIVEGTGGDDLIDTTYEGDPEGDKIDNNDAILPGEGPNDDIVVAGDGDDTVLAGEGNDEVYGNGGSDTLEGGAGDDILIGDASGPYGNGAGATTSTQEAFKWSELKDYHGGSLQNGEKIVSQSQDTGENVVTLTLNKSYDNTFSTDQQKVHSIDTGELPGANAHSSLESELDYKGDSQTYTLEFEKDAENVSFRVNDIDFDSTVVITAYDAEGNKIPVDMSAGDGVSLYDNDSVAGFDTAVSKGGGAADTSPTYSALVSVPGPVAKLVITHVQDGHSDSGVNVTDIYFDTITGEGEGEGVPGNDTILGGLGNDYIEGNAGADYLDGGEGADTVLGGDDADTIVGGAGDVVDGGAGGDDNDTLDLTLGKPFYLKDLEPDSNGNGWNGTVVYVDADGKPTGETMTFTEIENINGTPANQLPVAGDDVAKGDILNPVTIDVLGNDTDPDGDTLTIDSITQPVAGGTVVDNGDGTVTFTPDGTVDGDVTFEYTVSDGKGGFDTATVTVTLRDGIVEGTAGNDYIDEAYEGDPEGDMVDGGDNIFGGGPDDDIIDAGAGDDVVKAGVGDDVVFGGDGNDSIYGRGGNDILDGGAGNDYIEGGQNDDIIAGGEGNDTIYGQGGNDQIDGGAGDDWIRGGQDADVIEGGDGNDTIDGMSGDDTLSGGAGDDTIQGGGGEDLIDGGSGNDTLIGGNNKDHIIGGDGSDYVEGGGSDDYINTSGNLDAYGVSGSPDQGYPGIWAPDANPYDDRDTVYGGDGNDTIITGDDDDYIEGGAGNDKIDAGFDDDTVLGGDGDDIIVGGEGNDYLDGGAGNDIIYGGLNPVFPDALNIPDDAGDLRPDNGDDVIHGGAGNDTIYGQDDDDLIYGDEGDDYIDGGVDDDEIYGGTGNDTIIGGQGVDKLYGDDDRDTFLGGNAGDHVDGGSGGDDYDTLNLTGSDVDYIEYTSPDREDGIVHFNDGGTMTFEEIENVIPCFTPGTLIATPRGEVAVEELKVGDKIITRDNGIQEIRWLGRTDVDTVELMKRPALRPVRIAKGALDGNLPERDMLVSPQHRVLVASDRAALYFEEREVLVAAKHLVNGAGIAEAQDVASVTYIHFMFDQHEVVLSDGAWTESFQPGDYTLDGLDSEQREELLALFPELKEKEGLAGYTAARKTLKKHEALLLSE